MPKEKVSKKNSKKKVKKVKKETKEQKEKKERKELKRLDNELFEIDTEIKKVALNNKKVILEKWDEESEGLTSHIREIGLNDENSSPSLEMVNAPQRRLVPLERTLQVSTQAPSILGNNNGNKNEEFNPFKYNAGDNNSDPNGPKYTSYESGEGVKKIDIAEESRKTQESIVHTKDVGFKPMYDSEKKSVENYVPVKGAEDVSNFGRKKEEKTELKYNPSGA